MKQWGIVGLFGLIVLAQWLSAIISLVAGQILPPPLPTPETTA